MGKSLCEKWKDFMKRRKQIRQNLKAYKHKRSNIEKRVEGEYIDHGIATIPCKVEGIDDILSNYSVPGYESLNSEFKDYIRGIEEHIPVYCPMVISIVGGDFSEEEKETIKSTIEDEAAYVLGSAERDDKHLLKMSLVMIVGSIIFGLLIAWFYWWPDVSVELLYIFFWFFAYTLVEFIFLEGVALRSQRIRSARLACVSVVFSEEYDERDYTEEEAKEIFDRQE